MVNIGIDLGGTNIKVGIVDGDCRMLATGSRPTNLPRKAELICQDMVCLMFEVIEKAGLTTSDIHGIGIGSPGAIDDHTGTVLYSNNLNWRDFPLRAYLQKSFPEKPIHMGNDANVAAYGEYCAGGAKGASSAAIITLGTGVGSGIIIDDQIITGFNGAAVELGHMVIKANGRPCTCGRLGCWESYSSATGLISLAKEAMAEDQESLLWSMSEQEGNTSAKTVFDGAYAGDATAKKLVDDYITDLVTGLTNVINIFQPEIISLGGGISKQGEKLLGPLKVGLEKEVFGGYLSTVLNLCTLGNDAGIIGAGMLANKVQ